MKFFGVRGLFGIGFGGCVFFNELFSLNVVYGTIVFCEVLDLGVVWLGWFRFLFFQVVLAKIGNGIDLFSSFVFDEGVSI